MRAIELSQNSGLASRKQPIGSNISEQYRFSICFCSCASGACDLHESTKSLVASLTTDEVIPDDAEFQNYGADKAISCIKTIIGSTVQCSFIVACESLHSVKDLLAR